MGAPVRVDRHSPPGGQTKGSSLRPKELLTKVCAASRAILHSGCSVILAACCPRAFLGSSNYSVAPGPLSSIPTGWSILPDPSLFRSLPSTSLCLCFMPKEHLPADSYSGTPIPDSLPTLHSLDSDSSFLLGPGPSQLSMGAYFLELRRSLFEGRGRLIKFGKLSEHRRLGS